MDDKTVHAPADAPVWETHCLNCGTALEGHYCYRCGQRSGPDERSIKALCGEFFEMLTHADSKFWRTIRRLALSPASLTRDYVQGRRVSEIPPVRMFFVVIIMMFAVQSLIPSGHVVTVIKPDDTAHTAGQVQGWQLAGHPQITAWVHRHVSAAVRNPQEVVAVMREWSERFVLLLLPLASGMLWLLYLWPGHRHLYDHVIFTVHSLTFSFAVFTVAVALSQVLGDGAWWLLCWPPLHLYRHLRGFYGSSRMGTMLRMAVLLGMSLLAVTILLSALSLLSLQLGTSEAG